GARRGQGPRQPGGGKQIAGPRQRRQSVHGYEARGQRPSREKRRDTFPKQNADGREKGARAPAQDDIQQENAPAAVPTNVQTVAVTTDEAGMRVDRFLEARFP